MYNIITQLIGFVASATVVISFQIKNPKKLLVVNACAMLVFTIHFGMLGAISGMIQNFLGATRNFLSIAFRKDKHPIANRVAEVIIIAAFASVPFVQYFVPFLEFSAWGILPTLAMTVGSVFFWTGDSKFMRIGQLYVLSPCWLVYNVAMGSIAGVFTEIFNMASVIVSFARIKTQKKKKLD